MTDLTGQRFGLPWRPARACREAKDYATESGDINKLPRGK